MAADAPDLFASASAAWGEGRQEEAADLLRRLIAAEPRHVAALNTLAMIALNRGDARAALLWLERAAAAEPEAAAIRFNLFQAFEMAGDLERGLASLDEALAIDPYYVPAILAKAALLARLGRAAESLAMFRAILATGPRPESLPEPARRALAEGVAAVRADDERRAAALERPLAEVRAAYPQAEFGRALAYAEQRTGRRKVYAQQPIDGHFPYLPAIEFFARDHFPWFAELEAHSAEIRAELLALLARDDEGFRPYVAFGPTQPVNQWQELNNSRRWSAWFFWRDGARQDENCARCPATAALLERLPLLDLPGKGPTAMFSILEPRTRIPPHTGSNNVRATVHLPLVVPAGCGLRVGAETRTPREGEAWAFDDTIEHEAWNESDEPRAVFILDVWNPLLTEAERAAVRVIG
ncbi:MAG TPA: aspartyl/asparaginyl beta-hydroxylase domain-containing protein [Allosphingosinicella sp.]|nr:aspartyl/asparaginyl beta-hydroxylase domain-containing protein [Allosphingosinicella sp.]